MKFITFYSLPNDIAALILSKYLDWRSLCTLDSSCCMRESRKLLFVLWSSHHLVFHEIPLRDLLPELQTLCLNWVDKRSVKFTKVQVPGTVDVTTCDRLMRNRFSSVSLLAIEGREKSILAYLLSIATFKCKLIALSLIECNLSSTIGVILHNFPY